MDISMFTGFAGRINRQKWWLGTIALLVVILILYFILSSLLIGGFDPMAPDAMSSMMRNMAIMQIIVLAIICYPVTALMKKRLNDRDRPDWMVYLFWAPTIVGILINLLGLGYTTADVGGIMMPQASWLSMLVGLISLAVGIRALVELGFLKGTDGPNQHGPDPLAGA